jgi:LacI family transcriptional regulator
MAGVSLGTASSVLTARSGFRVSPETAARIQQAARQLDYRPSRLAQALATGKTKLIALIDYDFGASFSAHLGRHFHLALGADRYDLVIVGESTPADAVASMVDGAICCSRDLPAGWDDVLPVVQISPKADTRHDALHLDFHSGATAAMGTLARAGCQRIAFLGPGTGEESKDGRLVAYRQFLGQMGGPEIFIEADSDRQQEGYSALTRYAASEDWPQGIFCMNDGLALGAYRAIREAGLKVGRDIAVVGCDDIGGEFLDPPLTSIAVPFQEISTIAWDMLRERIQSPDLPARVLKIQPKFIERASSSLAR